MKKHILVIAKHNKVEALRVAIGLTLLSDDVKIAVLGDLEDSPAIQEQREVMEFAEVPCNILGDDWQTIARLAESILVADAVYLI